MDGNAVEDNYRPTQGVIDRIVYHHDVNAGGGTGSPAAAGPAPFLCPFVTDKFPALPGKADNYYATSERNCPVEGACAGLTNDLTGAENCQGFCQVRVYLAPISSN